MNEVMKEIEEKTLKKIQRDICKAADNVFENQLRSTFKLDKTTKLERREKIEKSKPASNRAYFARTRPAMGNCFMMLRVYRFTGLHFNTYAHPFPHFLP